MPQNDRAPPRSDRSGASHARLSLLQGVRFNPSGVGMLGAFVAYRADQSCTSFSRQRKYAKEVGLLEIDMQLPIDRRP